MAAPITRLAPRFGISDNGCRYLCLRMGVPTPPRGGAWLSSPGGSQGIGWASPPVSPNVGCAIAIVNRGPRLSRRGWSGPGSGLSA